MLCFCNSQQPDSICIKSSCYQPGKGVVGCVEYLWTSSNGCSSTTQLSSMARGWDFPWLLSSLLLWERKVIELKKEFQVVVCRLDFDLLHKVMSWPEVWCSRTGSGLKKYFQASWSPRTGSQASFEPVNQFPGLYQSRNWFPGLFQVPELVPRPLSSPWYERKRLALKFGHHTQKTVVHLALETFQWCHLTLMSYAKGCHKNTNMPHIWLLVLENHDEGSLTYLCTARFLQ